MWNRKGVPDLATDAFVHVPCGHDGWGHLAAVIDCRDREAIGSEFVLCSRAKEAERVVEAACLQRFGTPIRSEHLLFEATTA